MPASHEAKEILASKGSFCRTKGKTVSLFQRCSRKNVQAQYLLFHSPNLKYLLLSEFCILAKLRNFQFSRLHRVHIRFHLLDWLFVFGLISLRSGLHWHTSLLKRHSPDYWGLRSSRIGFLVSSHTYPCTSCSRHLSLTGESTLRPTKLHACHQERGHCLQNPALNAIQQDKAVSKSTHSPLKSERNAKTVLPKQSYVRLFFSSADPHSHR
mmetsp:Transcript_26062/g.102351  ORF Transcript_26062/g.102351 Transcript_26062/m.102351 type:complete len:211 (+) Transcript_26062:266-898(+)